MDGPKAEQASSEMLHLSESHEERWLLLVRLNYRITLLLSLEVSQPSTQRSVGYGMKIDRLFHKRYLNEVLKIASLYESLVEVASHPSLFPLWL